MGTEYSVEPLGAADLELAVTALTRAFLENPATHRILYGYGPVDRERILRRVLRGFTRAYHRYCRAEIVKQEGDVVGVSLSAAPGQYPLAFMGELHQASGCVASGPRVAYRYARMGAHVEKRHPRHPHWYLFFLGVIPELQGRGIGGALLRALSRRAATDQVPCYLETDKESSVRLYGGHGYEVVHTQTYPDFEDLRLWYMLKPTPAP